LVVDVETTTKRNGHPFTNGNKLVTVQLKTPNETRVFPIEYEEKPYGDALRAIRKYVEESEILIGVNIKFDLHWLRNYIPDLVIHRQKIWDISIAHFIMSGQRHVMPSMDGVAEFYGLPLKPNIIKTEYWEKGLDTTDVPWPILEEYGIHDVEIPYQIWRRQLDDQRLSLAQRKLVYLQGQDLLALLECERNGLLFDRSGAEKLYEQTNKEIGEIYAELGKYFPYSYVKWGSDDHVSALLYGGTIREKKKIQYIRELKAGPAVREKWGEEVHIHKGIMKPLKRYETLPTKEWSDEKLESINAERIQEGKSTFCRIYSVSEPVLKQIRPKVGEKARKIIDLLLQAAKLDKLANTYYKGLLNLLDECGSTDNIIHGQFNQTVAITGRLSSSNPNLQNFEPTVKQLMTTEWPSLPTS
jgi:DNA polymerase I-like protein with 3'-5' exonuclease and polymerase domains